MKKFICIILSAAIMLSLAACVATDTEQQTEQSAVQQQTAPQQTVQQNYEELYAPVLDSCFDYVVSEEKSPVPDGFTGILEALYGRYGSEAADSIGYAIRDISGDGVPELVIGGIKDRLEQKGSEIYAVYTCAKGEPQLSFEGWTRNSFDLLDDGSFFNYGSSGAMSSCLGTFALSNDAALLECVDFYFSAADDYDDSQINYYHNTSGSWDPAASERLEDLSYNAFWSYADDKLTHAVDAGLTPFSAYKEVPASAEPAPAPATATVAPRWEEDALYTLDDYDVFYADEVSTGSGVVFMTDVEVKDFRILSLTLESVDDDGNIVFASEEVGGFSDLTPERPILVYMTFAGDIPNYGISYTDVDGTVKTFALQISGFDGSLVLMEI